MGHGKSDRPYLSAAEHSGVYGSHSASSGKTASLAAAFEPVAFDCCALSFQPWTLPVCSPDCGVAFELTNLIPFLRKYGVHPITGRAFELDDVVRLNFARNEQGRFHDPVSMREFGQHSHIVAIRQTGNVFLYDTVLRLNIKPKYMRDLVTDQPFTKADIITVHDPNRPELRDARQMHHVKEELALTQQDKGIDTTQQINTAATGSAKRLLAKLGGSTGKEPKAAPKSTALSRNKAGGASTGMAAASFTSSSLTPRTAIERVELDDEQTMFAHVRRTKRKAYVRLTTNLGALNLELHCDVAPRTCYNFVQLCKQGGYDGVVFHRNIPGFMIQGGDPTGTGRGGSSIWGHDFVDEYGEAGALKHSSRGMLSMANRGPGTNGSQFFLTYRPVPHLDGKHTVFGQLVDGAKDATLAKMEAVPTSDGDRPIRKIRIETVLVSDDPFEVYTLKQKDAAKANDPTNPEYIARMERKRRREHDRTTWLGTELQGKDDKAKQILTAATTVGKYMPQTQTQHQSKDQPQASKKRRAGFGDFSSW